MLMAADPVPSVEVPLLENVQETPADMEMTDPTEDPLTVVPAFVPSVSLAQKDDPIPAVGDGTYHVVQDWLPPAGEADVVAVPSLTSVKEALRIPVEADVLRRLADGPIAPEFELEELWRVRTAKVMRTPSEAWCSRSLFPRRMSWS